MASAKFSSRPWRPLLLLDVCSGCVTGAWTLRTNGSLFLPLLKGDTCSARHWTLYWWRPGAKGRCFLPRADGLISVCLLTLGGPPSGRGELGQVFPDSSDLSSPDQDTRQIGLPLAGVDNHSLGGPTGAAVAEMLDAPSDSRPQAPIGGRLGLFVDYWDETTTDL